MSLCWWEVDTEVSPAFRPWTYKLTPPSLAVFSVVQIRLALKYPYFKRPFQVKWSLTQFLWGKHPKSSESFNCTWVRVPTSLSLLCFSWFSPHQTPHCMCVCLCYPTSHMERNCSLCGFLLEKSWMPWVELRCISFKANLGKQLQLTWCQSLPLGQQTFGNRDDLGKLANLST